MFPGEQQSGRWTPGNTSNTDLYATLAISEDEARTGTTRILTLPYGKTASVSIPPGAQNGQIIELSNPGTTIGSTSSGILRLTLSVLSEQQTDDAGTLSQYAQTFTGDTSTFISSPDRMSPDAQLADGNSPTVAAPWQRAMPYPGSPMQQPPASTTPSPASIPGFFPDATPQLEKPPRRGRGAPRNTLVIAITVALIVVLGSAGLLYALRGSGSGSPGAGTPGVTATGQANGGAISTAQANATASAQSTATVEVQATATAAANTQAQANATATAVAAYNANPYGGTLVMNDPLVDNSQGHQWREYNDTSLGNSCQFTNNAYHMVMIGNYGGSCLADATNFSNFAFQVQMTFFKYGQHFSGGGLVFRGNSATSQYYVLKIFESGQYTFYSCSSKTDCSHGIAGYPAASTIQSFHLGLHQTNTIAVVAKGNTFTFYANGQPFAGPITDTTYTQGVIGFYAEGGSEGGAGATADVAYSNAKVWQL